MLRMLLTDVFLKPSLSSNHPGSKNRLEKGVGEYPKRLLSTLVSRMNNLGKMYSSIRGGQTPYWGNHNCFSLTGWPVFVALWKYSKEQLFCFSISSFKCSKTCTMFHSKWYTVSFLYVSINVYYELNSQWIFNQCLYELFRKMWLFLNKYQAMYLWQKLIYFKIKQLFLTKILNKFLVL